ncbi:hypothetical protein M2152_002449 [Microbacteriaceae bacterium SG_E_30_P1]|uniref:LPXTG cell wall anchor domain-containing protein n=1 Tax=Antiquaquibacter oligotrophicus TaxID=2880260 RepID=A0ABT6KSU2_9MICO|nr:hypothetical protein [Antiquaquibacter oligotrophicus]MDH6182267.1 hypothetical protein [Antiquaquibacter oligotrophicus]UDF12076.1 hypothetical protein LH407_07815 [Antiquaquibacter oligotrophicus]
MLKKFLAVVTTLLIAFGLSVVAVAAPASAHHTDLSAKADCKTEGGWTITWTVINSENFEGEVTSSNNTAIPTGTKLAANPNYGNSNSIKNTFTQTVTSNSPVNTTITVKWFRQGNTVSHTSNVTFSSFPADCFNWNWEYPAPTCESLTVTYPSGIPAGQANDVNVRIKYGVNFANEVTLNFHNNTGTWSGTQSFVYAQHPNWPANIGQYKVVWVQVGGTNYHWQGEVTCGELPKDASAEVSTTTPTCEQGSSLVPGAIVNATWGTPVINGNSYSIVATANPGHLFADGNSTKTFSGTLQGPKTGGVCDDVSVAITITYVPECAVDPDNTWRVFNPSDETIVVTYNGLTHSATPGYSTITTPRSMDPITLTWGADESGIKPGSVVGTPGADLTGEDEECYTAPDVTKVVGQCAYFEDGTAGNRTVSITYDNTDSNVPVTFSLQGFAGVYDRTVPAGESVTVEAPNVLPAGGTYTVTAAGETFNLVIEPCPTFEKPEPKVEQRPVASFECGDTQVTIVTTTFTAEPVFNTETLEWGWGEWVEGESVTTYRAPLPEEISEEGCAIVVTDPSASTCTPNGATDLTSWIRVELNPNVEFRIDGEIVTAEFTSVTAGEHEVTATALNGYTLESVNPEPDYWTGTSHAWTFTAVDAAVDCVPTLADVLPSFDYEPLTCDTDGSFTIGAEFGDVSWTVNGTEYPQGTYPVTEASTVTLEAYPTNPEDTLNEAWIDEPIVLTFEEPASGCGFPLIPKTPEQLAFTGAAASVGIGWAGALVVLTGLGLVILRRKASAN